MNFEGTWTDGREFEQAPGVGDEQVSLVCCSPWELEKSAQRIKAEAITKVPYKTGKLERSIYVRVAKDKRRPGIVAGASARSSGGYNYAGIQHENENYYHARGQAHFISEPFNAEVKRLKQRIKRRLKITNGS